jgi:hypothetical protein
MAARRTKRKTTRRSRPKTFNVAGLAESALLANAITQGFFNCTLNDFVFSTSGSSGGQGRSAITGRELIAGLTGGVGGYGTMQTVTSAKMGGGVQYQTFGVPFGEQVKENLKDNGAKMIGSLILIPAGFKVFKKLSRKPLGTMNKALKMSGLPVRV